MKYKSWIDHLVSFFRSRARQWDRNFVLLLLFQPITVQRIFCNHCRAPVHQNARWKPDGLELIFTLSTYARWSGQIWIHGWLTKSRRRWALNPMLVLIVQVPFHCTRFMPEFGPLLGGTRQTHGSSFARSRPSFKCPGRARSRIFHSRSFLAFTTVPFLAVFGQLMRLIAMRGTAHFSEASTATEIFCLLELHAPIMSLYSRLRYKVYIPSGSWIWSRFPIRLGILLIG